MIQHSSYLTSVTCNTVDPYCNKIILEKDTYITNFVFYITRKLASHIAKYEDGPLRIQTDYSLVVEHDIVWDNPYLLSLVSKENLIIRADANITSYADVELKAGIGGCANGTASVIFELKNKPQIYLKNASNKVAIHYNPVKHDGAHKHTNPYSYFDCVNKSTQVESFMLINNADDMSNMYRFKSQNYALACDIDFAKAPNFKMHNFYGNFDGNGFAIKNLYISEPNQHNVGLFSCIMSKSPLALNSIKNLIIKGAHIEGLQRVGALAGSANSYSISNVSVHDSVVKGQSTIGGLAGAAVFSVLDIDCQCKNITFNQEARHKGLLLGAVQESKVLGFVVPGLVGYASSVVNGEDYTPLKKYTSEVLKNQIPQETPTEVFLHTDSMSDKEASLLHNNTSQSSAQPVFDALSAWNTLIGYMSPIHV